MFKKILFISSVFFSLLFSMSTGDVFADAAAQTVTAVAPAKAPVGWWKFDGNAKDSTGSNHGIENGNPAYKAGVSGQAINFDGKDDFTVVTDDGGNATIEFGKGSFSITFWVKSNFVGIPNSDVKEYIICNGTNGTEFDGGSSGPGGRASGKRYVIAFEDDDFCFFIDDDAVKTVLEGASNDFATGDWVHAAAVRDTAVYALRMYCNGQLVNTTVDTTGDISSPGEPLFIGAKQKEDAHANNPASAPFHYFFKGMLDDLRIYDYALSQTEIANIMGLSKINVSPPSAEELFDIARKYERSKKYQQAISIYQQIMKQYPDSPEADKAQLDIPKMQILSLLGSGKEQETQAVIDNLITNFSQSSYLPEMLYGIAKNYQESDEFERAISIYQKVATHCPASDYALMAQTNLILSFISMGRISESKQALNKLFEEFQGHSDFPKAIYEVADLYKKAGENGQAEALYKTIITNYPDTDHAFKSQKKLTILYIEAGKDAEAQMALNRLITKFAKHPDLLNALESIAGKYKKADKDQQAQNIYQKIAIDYPGTDYAIQTQKNLAVINIKQGNDTEALKMLDKLIVDFHDHPLAPEVVYTIGEQYYNKACQYEDQGLADEAKDSFQKAIAVWEKIITQLSYSDDVPDAYYYLATCCHRLGEYEKAIEYFRKVVTDCPDFKYAWNAQFMVGHIYENLEKSGVISESEAEPRITAAYQQLLEKYPSCKAAKYVQRWLSRHNFSK